MILVGDCVELMRELDEASVDAIVTDPPYELGFMGKAWDASGVTYQPSTWAEALRVLKPGGHLLAFGGTRTYHRLACAIEDAGFEIRDCLAWMFGSGFPKSLDVSKAIDRAAGVEREVVGPSPRHGGGIEGNGSSYELPPEPHMLTAPATDDARTWQGWGTALKPAHEPIVVARKPLAGTVAANVLEYGTGALNVDGCRIEGVPPSVPQPEFNSPTGQVYGFQTGEGRNGEMSQASGRWPANVLLDEEAASALDRSVAPSTSRIGQPRSGRNGDGWGMTATGAEYDDEGGPSRFFYVAKASRAERNAGLEGFEEQVVHDGRQTPIDNAYLRAETQRRNTHPTVKPVGLMRWLVRLVTPPGGTVLDPFAGSGTTGIACALEGFDFLGMEQDAEYAKIAEARIAFWKEHGEDGLRIVAEREKAEAAREEIAAAGQLDLLAEGAA